MHRKRTHLQCRERMMDVLEDSTVVAADAADAAAAAVAGAGGAPAAAAASQQQRFGQLFEADAPTFEAAAALLGRAAAELRAFAGIGRG